jgi:hypothetical protein
VGAAAVSLALCAAVLGLAYYVWSQPNTRPMIDRISFRLLLWSVAFEMGYDIAYILVEMDVSSTLGLSYLRLADTPSRSLDSQRDCARPACTS